MQESRRAAELLPGNRAGSRRGDGPGPGADAPARQPGPRESPALATLSAARVAPLLFLSGACALVYQIAWLRELRAIFGASTSASAAVLAVFMGGLGAGGVLLRRRIERSSSPLFFYAHLELLIATAAAATPLLVLGARAVYLGLGGVAALGSGGATVARVVLAALVLGPATLLMGGTLPAASRAVTARGDVGRRGVAQLYGANTLGAVLGAALANFMMLEVFGTRLTLWMAALTNVLIGLVARVVARTAEPEVRGAGAARAQESSPALRSPPRWFPALAAGVTGFVFLLMELVWYRMLAPLLGGSSYTFGLILAVALAGIGAGGVLYARRPVGTRPTMVAFGATCVLEAVALALPYALGDRLAVLAILLRPLGTFGFYGHVAAWSVVTAIVVLPAAIVAGYQFPLTIALFGERRAHVARAVAFAYAANTLGSIAGSLAGGFGLMPLYTAPGCWRAAVWAPLALGLGAAVFGYVRQGGSRRSVAVSFALACAGFFALRAEGPTAAWRHSPIGAGRVALAQPTMNAATAFVHVQRSDIVWEADGVESTVAVGSHESYNFIVSGKSDGSAITDAPTQVMSGLLGAALRPAARSAFVVGLGTGSTAGWLGAIPEMEVVDVVELEPAIYRVAEKCSPVNHDVLHNPKVHVRWGDAREYILTTGRRYDLVFSEPSNPYRAGIAGFFTEDFYRAVASRLTQDGIFLQWVQFYEVDGEVVRTVLATLAGTFPNVSLWETTPGDVLLVATRDRQTIDLGALRSRLAQEPFRSAMDATWRTTDVEGFVAHHIASNTLVREVHKGVPEANTDDRNTLEYAFARNVGKGALEPAAEMWSLSKRRRLDRPEVVGELDWMEVDARRSAMDSEVGRAAGKATPTARSLYAAFSHYWRGELGPALAAWRASGRAPVTAFERMLVGEALADAGDDATDKAVDALADRPAEAHLVRARWLARRGDPAAAAGELEEGLRAYRTNPWVDRPLASRALGLAAALAQASPALAERMVALLGEPFAVHALDDRRMRVRAEVAVPASPRCVEVMRSFEPWIPWERAFLERRYDCYHRHGRVAEAARAEAELRQYIERSPTTIGAALVDPPELPAAD